MPGELIVADGQLELGGLLMGEGTDYVPVAFTVWNGADVESADQSLAGDGIVSAADRLGGRPVLFTCRVRADTPAEYEPAVAALAGVWTRATVSVTLAYRLVGATRLLHGRPRGAFTRLAPGLETECRFVATDPRIYSFVETVFVLPATVGHDGNTAAPFRVSIPGPVTAPELRRTDTAGLVLRWPTLTVSAGQSLEVNTRTQTAVVGGVDVWGLADDGAGGVPLDWGIPPSGVAMTAVGDATVWVADTWL